jgi:leucyl-tRNA synthetase
MVVAPEHELVSQITTAAQKPAIEEYLAYVKSRSERERMAEAKTITGCFTGAYAVNPFDGREIPIWIAEYVLAGYGTGAIMAVPCGDQRDFGFAKHFNIPITNIIGAHFNGEEANSTKDAVLENSGFLNGLLMKDAIGVAVNKIEELGIGKRKVNYRMRDAGFSRQRYWGEPFPIIWSDGVALPLDAEELPLELPHVDKYGPGPSGEGPLANLTNWVDLTPNPSPKERGTTDFDANKTPGYINSSAEEWKKTIAFAKQNRKDATVEEDIIWQELRNRKIGGFKFRRQHPVAGYIPDFVCLEKRLIVEIDGEYHNEEEQKIFDKARENWLNEEGFTLLRFTNDAVNNRLNTVLKDIEQALITKEKVTESAESSSPLFWRGVGGEVRRETSTMPGYAGSSWYFLRYMDPHNSETFCDRKASDYWNQVDLYIGGTEHAVGHLLYSRLWTKVLFDLGLIGFDEPFRKLLNQGMITGKSYFFNVIVIDGTAVSKATMKITSYDKESSSDIFLRLKYGHQFVDNNGKLTKKILLKQISDGLIEEPPYEIIWEKDGEEEFVFVKEESEKMSKSKFNVDNPDELCNKYGADTFRMYEMFLGPVEASKPWDTKGIEGVHRFLRKLWRLFNDDVKGKIWTDDKATDAELKVLHRTIKKIEDDTERFSFNTAVSTFMICLNELADLKCSKIEILQQVLILLTPYAPHIAEELWSQLGNEGSILDASYPAFNAALLVESSKEYPVSINGKLRTNINLALNLTQPQVEELVLQNEIVRKWLEGNAPKKIIFVKNKMINVVI